MKVRFLGTGTSQGVPVIACDCEVCQSSDPKDQRLRCSVLIETEKKSIVIDTGPDFRQQMLRENVQRLDAVLMTHEHKDHLAGLDDVRAFNFKQGRDVDVFATPPVQEAIQREYSYIFAENKYPGIPRIALHHLDKSPLNVAGIQVIPIEVMHYKMPVMGFRIDDFTYITDAKTIAEEEMEKIKGSKVLVLNALRKEDHISHLTLDEAIKIGEEIEPDRLYLTHISHLLGLQKEIEKTLPSFVKLAYDGLHINL